MAKYRQGGWNKTPKPTGYKMNSFKHNFLKCSCGKKHCRVCSEQIENVCTKCGLSKETLTTNCCGSALTKESFDNVQNGTLDYHVEKGGWIHINKDGESDGTAIDPNPAPPQGEAMLGYSAWRANRASNNNSAYINEPDYSQGNLGGIQEEIGGGPYDSVDEAEDDEDDVVAINEIKGKVIKKARKFLHAYPSHGHIGKGYNPISESEPRRKRRSRSSAKSPTLQKLEKPKKIKRKPRKKA